MQAFRRHLPSVAVLGLFIQLSGSAISALALCCPSPAAKVAQDEHACCKGLEPGQVCPLHGKAAAPTAPAAGHHHNPTPKPADDSCAMTNACKVPDLALLSIIGTGILPAPVSLGVEFESAPVASVVVPPLARDLVPDTPPPRA